MVLFVYHDAKGLAAIDNDGAAYVLRGVLPTNEMPLDQDLLFQRREILQHFRKRILHFRQLLDAWFNQLKDLSALGFLGPPGKGALPEISCEPDAAADHDLVMRPFAAQPFAAGRHDVRKFHPKLPSRVRAV